MPIALLLLLSCAPSAADGAAASVLITERDATPSAAALDHTSPEAVEVRRRLRLPDRETFTWSACLGFARIGSLIAWGVVEDDLWTLGLITAAGATLGFALGALVLGGILVAIGVGLLAAGVVTLPWLWVVLGLGGAAAGGVIGLLTGLPVGASIGLAASIDEGELTLQF